MEYLETKIQSLILEARKLELKVAYHQLAVIEQDGNDDLLLPQYLQDEEEEYIRPFEGIISSLYLSTVCYLNQKNLHEYLEIFYKIFGHNYEKPKYRDNFEYEAYWTGEYHNEFLGRLNIFLSVFEFSGIADEKYRQLVGIKYLETILKNTQTIILKSEKEPKSETDVYKIVKNIIEAVFVKYQSPRSNFLSTMKEYKPDILIPEIYSAVEYKYAKNENKLKSTIEQIAADVKGYTGDPKYKLFYAVFYVTEDFWGIDKFEVIWKEQGFPKNWIGVYVVGNK